MDTHTPTMLQIRSVADAYSVNGVAIPSDRFVALDHFGNHGSVESKSSFHALMVTLSKAHQDRHGPPMSAKVRKRPLEVLGTLDLRTLPVNGGRHPAAKGARHRVHEGLVAHKGGGHHGTRTGCLWV